jgi:arylsulfatase
MSTDPTGSNGALATKPNILLVLSDQHRGDWQQSLGARFLNTPNMLRLAQEGVSFRDAVCASPLCAPSRICLATARNYGHAPTPERPLRDNGDFLPASVPNFYQALRRAGYAVASCGKSDLRKPCQSWGLDGRHVVDGFSEWNALGFSHGLDSAGKHDAVKSFGAGLPEPYFDFLRRHGLADIHARDFVDRPYPNYANCSPTPLPDFAYGDNFIGEQALALLQQLDDGPPWFLQVNFMGPHEPMDVTPAMQSDLSSRDLPLADLDPCYDAAQHLAIRRNYVSMIENIDTWLGHFLAVLESSGRLDNTVVVYASDHGEMLGEHEEWTKWVPYRPSIAVPLIFRGPNISHHVDDCPASLIDLGPTLLDLAGAEPMEAVDGQSLRDRIETPGDAGEDSFRVVGLGCWRAVVTSSHTLIVGYRPGMTHAEMIANAWSGACNMPLLFDRRADPNERHNLAAENPLLVETLFNKMRQTS